MFTDEFIHREHEQLIYKKNIIYVGICILYLHFIFAYLHELSGNLMRLEEKRKKIIYL